MARKPKGEGLEALVAKQDPVSIQEITMLDWYASFALMAVIDLHDSNKSAVTEAFDIAEDMLEERRKRI